MTPKTLEFFDDGCCTTNDDLVEAVVALVEEQMEIASRVERLLNGDAGRTVEDMANILDVSEWDIATALAHLTQAGAMFVRLPLATGETGYQLAGWL